MPRIPERVRIVTEPAGYGCYAVDDNTYDGPGSTVGWGKTESEAIEDLLEKLEDKE